MSIRATPENFTRLGKAVSARRNYLLWSRDKVHARGGPSVTSLTSIEAGVVAKYRPQTLRPLDQSLGWPTGTCESILDGDALDIEALVTKEAPADSASPDPSLGDGAPSAGALFIEIGRVRTRLEGPVRDLVQEFGNPDHLYTIGRISQQLFDMMAYYNRLDPPPVGLHDAPPSIDRTVE